MKASRIIINWCLFVLIGLGIFNAIRFRHYLSQYLPSLPERGTMTGLQVIIFALSFAFMWVEVLKWWKHVKPFNCLKCMAGWSAVILAFTFHVEFWYMYLFVGLFVGALFTAIKLRWL
jgi:hypothetical protein